MRTTPARSPSSGVEALLTPNRLAVNNATHHHHDGENTPTRMTTNNRQQSGGRKAKTPLKSPLAVVGLLSPNDDTLERQQSMKKRQTVSAFRRELSKNVEKQLENIDVAHLSSSSSDEEEDDGEENADGHENVEKAGGREKQQQKKKPAATTNKPKLTQDAVMNLYANCIKLASENKINAKNTWSLALIDHISIPARPIKAIAMSPAEIKVSPSPLSPFGASAYSSRSLIPPRHMTARKNPAPEPKP